MKAPSGRRKPAVPYGDPIGSRADLAWLRPMLGGRCLEILLVLGLSRSGRLIQAHAAATGDRTSVTARSSAVFRPLIRAGAAYGILAHNHPSGRPRPSDADVEQSVGIWELGLLLGIEIVDSLVVTRREIISLAELGLLPSRLVAPAASRE